MSHNISDIIVLYFYLSMVMTCLSKNALNKSRENLERHTYAILQRKAGKPIEVICRILGHASEMVILTVYNHWDGEMKAAIDTMALM